MSGEPREWLVVGVRGGSKQLDVVGDPMLDFFDDLAERFDNLVIRTLLPG